MPAGSLPFQEKQKLDNVQQLSYEQELLLYEELAYRFSESEAAPYLEVQLARMLLKMGSKAVALVHFRKVCLSCSDHSLISES